MNLIYETVHFKGSQDLESFVQQKMNRIFRTANDIVQARVTLSEDGQGKLENQVCEIRLEMPGNDVFVKKSATTFEQAFRVALEAARKILRRRK